ncbi:uncharacterized protein PV09_08844 [Verruconis gallopava]|uniref:DNA replication checkpoint mediator MRC1 domain-containing protein n=1 Tax=Verruconis gallopava TaxID=253628 RepID=A0A0D1ZZU7_9PEZI|nr:uncharacterized protein PV09_08844 [Verruconis gallopava]KIV99544.1 hypothetical protein PV09_08844 [Verruconis gallopava]
MDPDSLDSRTQLFTEQAASAQSDHSSSRFFARDTIVALLEGSDSEDEGAESLDPLLKALPSSSQDESAKDTRASNFDIDLEDEAIPQVPLVNRSPTTHVTTQDDEDGSAAYARLMKSIFSKPKHTAVLESKLESEPSGTTPREEVRSREDDMLVTMVNSKPKLPSESPAVQFSSPKQQQRVRSPSAGLFVSPTPSRRTSSSPRADENNASDSDEMPCTIGNARLRALVTKKKAEREAKEREEQRRIQTDRRKEAQRQNELAKQYKEIYSSEIDDGMTEDAQKSLTESSRPTQRKASKKALEEMNRETQRIARNQQLAHQARVKRKFTTLDFVNALGLSSTVSDDQSRNHGALVSSDSEPQVSKDTPPSSPPSLGDSQKESRSIVQSASEDEYVITTVPTDEDNHDHRPYLEPPSSGQLVHMDKGKGKETLPSSSPKSKPTQLFSKGSRRSADLGPISRPEDSDDDLEIIFKQPKALAVFDRVPRKNSMEPVPLLSLRVLSHVSPPSNNNRASKHSMTRAQLQIKLAQEMQRQMAAEKHERIETMKARGYVFKTEEEMEEDQLFIENQLEKARKEAMELARKEGEAAKKNGGDIDENYALLSDDESDDGEFEGDEEDDDPEVEISGSEDDGDAVEEEEEEEESGFVDKNGHGMDPTGLVNDEAEEADEDGKSPEDAHGDTTVENAQTLTDDEDVTPTIAPQKSRHRNVILDDEDDDLPAVTVHSTIRTSTQMQSSPFNAFGFALPNPNLSLTQMFKGTMEDLATQQDDAQAAQTRKASEFLQNGPSSSSPVGSQTSASAGLLVESSQVDVINPAKQDYPITPTPRFNNTQVITPMAVGSQISPSKLSEIPEPTQDAGFEKFKPPIGEIPFSTADTVMIPISESPVVPKQGKLRRRAEQNPHSSDDETTWSDKEARDKESSFELTTNAFDALFKPSRKPALPDAFDKKRSEAKAMIEEQAEESEDEYAGLGGASDDESDNDVDEEVQKMIDEGPVDVNEAELARFFADKDKAEDEKRIDKLYRDITTGALRRKRGVGFDELSDDSDDEAAERRKRKQLEFQKMRKAMMEDENISKIADNPKKLAFLKAIEDREDFDDTDYLDDMDAHQSSSEVQLSASTDLQQASQIVTEKTAAPLDSKRKLPADFISGVGKENLNRDGIRRRRLADETPLTKRPTGMAEIRESLSFLIDEPLVPDSQHSDNSDEEVEDEDDEEGQSGHLRRRRNDGNGSAVLTSVRASVINRLTLSRQNSGNMDEEFQIAGSMAFHTSNSSSHSGFKVPSLLRRATTNLSTTSSGSSHTATPTNETTVRMGGSKRSNIHFQAREAERMKKMREAERRRTEGIRKSVIGKGRMSILGNSFGGLNNGFE